MIANNEIVYSNDLCSAYLTAIVREFETHHPKAYLGRTAMQKLTYFVKVLGAPVPCSFDIYTYGPYSDAVTFSVESLLADDVIMDRSPTSKYSNYRRGPNADALLAAFADTLAPHQGTIAKTVEVLGGFDPRGLELIATLHFIAQRQANTGGEPTKESAMREFKSIKHDKFTDAQISTWYDALVSAGLITI